LILIVLGSVTSLYIYKREFTFDLRKIGSNLGFQADWELPGPQALDIPAVQAVLSQDFYFLGSGAQCYAYLGEDGHTVLKLFKHHHLWLEHPLDFLPLPWLQSYLKERRTKRQLRCETLFRSCHLAAKELPQTCGIEFAHLNKTPDCLHTEIRFQDRFGSWHSIESDDYEFLLQRKAEPIDSFIHQAMQNGDLIGAQAAVRSVIKLVGARCDKGIKDYDPAFMQNYGISNGKALHLDFGSLKHCELVRYRPLRDQEILRVTRPFREWLTDSHPALLPCLDRCLHDILNTEYCLPLQPLPCLPPSLQGTQAC
jgi:hypothetical protein